MAIRQAAAAAKQAALLGADLPAAAAFPMRPPDAPVSAAPAAPSSAASQAAAADANPPAQPPAGTTAAAEGAHAAAALGPPGAAGVLDPGLGTAMAGSGAALAPTHGADGSEPSAKRRKSNYGGG